MNNVRDFSIVQSLTDGSIEQAPVQWAISQLNEALTSKDVVVRFCDRVEEATDLCILVADAGSEIGREVLCSAGVPAPDGPECLALAPGKVGEKAVVLAWGSDVRGLVYALTELADRVVHSVDPMDALAVSEAIVERPANEIRSIARLFTSEVEDKAWFYDRSFWQQYLSMLVAQRFNRFSLTLGLGYNFPRNVSDVYFYFAYPYLVSVPGYEVHVPIHKM